ncbi:MAG: tyrosine-protein phosphatase [Ilumatobacteraceae bacterium]
MSSNGLRAEVLPDVGSHPDRLVPLEAVHNFRDLGGYPTADGRVTKWRTLFRADGLYRLAGDDLEVIRRLGLKTVIDLRMDAELAERGRFPEAEHPVAFHHLTVLDTTWAEMDRPEFDDDADFLHWAYHQMLASGGPNFGAAINVLAGDAALPAVFHCAAGKDRTGITAMLVLGALGVPKDYIAADYALTEAGMERMRVWAEREFPELAGQAADVPSAFFAALPAAMSRLIDDLVARHGSVRAFVRTLGVSEASLVALDAALLDDPA